MTIRKAKATDVSAIVALLANDPLGRKREDYRSPLPDHYPMAFEEIATDPNQELMVAEDASGEIIGTLQLSFIRYLTYRGGLRAQIEAVRIHESQRGQGLGQQLIEWAIARAKARNAHVVQLNTDKQRPAAIRFYENLGFTASHEGMKIHLDV